MKQLVRIVTGVAIMGVGLLSAQAQGIRIDTTDIKAIFAAGKTVAYHIDTLTGTANIGATGASSWDFSGLLTHRMMRLESVPPATTPYFAGFFPAATHALRDTGFTYSFYYASLQTMVDLKGTGYNYMTLGADFFDYGFKGAGTAFIGGIGIPAEGQWIKSPPLVYYDLPLEMSKNWISGFNETLSGTANSPFGPLAIGPSVTVHTVGFSVDAYGLLTVPGSQVQDALRIRKVDRYSEGTTQGVRVSYIFVAKNGASVQFNTVDTLSTSGTISVSAVQWTGATPTGIQAVSTTPRAFSLGQNYPNPFNPSTRIRFTLPERQKVTLKIYNLLGGEVATVVDQLVEAGESSVTFDARGLASGIYFYKLQAGSATQTRRMMLLK